MPLTQPLPGKAGLFAMPSSGKPPRHIALYRLACHAVNLSRAVRRQYVRACLLCGQSVKSYTTPLCTSHSARRQPSADRNHAGRSIPHAFKASPVEGLAARQCSAAQYGAMSTAPQRIHAAPGGLFKFAQNRAVQALQNRPISTTRGTLQELPAAISNGLVAFRSTPGNAAQGPPDRPPGVDALRICAVGVEFS